MSEFDCSQDKKKLDIKMIHKYLSERSYWAQNRLLETVKISIANSYCFGIYNSADEQVAFARVVTDGAVFGWVMDVFVLEEYRGLGLGKRLMHEIVNHPVLSRLKRIGLGTDDAHGLYKQYGFTELRKPGNMMELVR